MRAPVRLVHTHTCSMRLASGAEALVVRVLAEGGIAGYGFTFSEDVAAAREMAAWDAAARASGRPLVALLEAHPGLRAALIARAPAPGHPWSEGWRARLAGDAAAMPWEAETGFRALAWAEPAPARNSR